MAGYSGRFAPSPTGPLHAGSLVAALGSWLDARANRGRWLVRIEDIDTPRCVPGAAERILQQLAACGLLGDAPPLWQSTRGAAYAAALQALVDAGQAYPCGCTRSEIAALQPRRRFGELVYPGTCRSGLHGKPARAWRLRVEDGLVTWHDRRLGPHTQDVGHEVGDFVLRRADGLWAYQLAAVVDDAAQGISDVVRGADLADNTPRQIVLQHALGVPTPRHLHLPLVRGEDGAKLSKQNGAAPLDVADLADNTPRQIVLQRALGVPTPRHLHLPLVRGEDGAKLSKQNGATPLDVADPLAALRAAARVLGLPELPATTLADWLAAAVKAWAGIIPGPTPEDTP